MYFMRWYFKADPHLKRVLKSLHFVLMRYFADLKISVQISNRYCVSPLGDRRGSLRCASKSLLLLAL